MPQTTTQPAPAQLVRDDEANLWLPPRGMAAYQRNKLVGGILFCLIFVVWLIVNWANLPLRILAMVLLALTAWVTAASVMDDRHRYAGRQLAVRGDKLVVVTSQDEKAIPFHEIHHGQWRDDDDQHAGLWLIGHNEKKLAHIDVDFLQDEAEARTFVGWVRERTTHRFDVRWPEVTM